MKGEKPHEEACPIAQPALKTASGFKMANSCSVNQTSPSVNQALHWVIWSSRSKGTLLHVSRSPDSISPKKLLTKRRQSHSPQLSCNEHTESELCVVFCLCVFYLSQFFSCLSTLPTPPCSPWLKSTIGPLSLLLWYHGRGQCGYGRSYGSLILPSQASCPLPVQKVVVTRGGTRILGVHTRFYTSLILPDLLFK